MPGARGRARHAALSAVLASMLAWCPCVLALNPELDVSQYAHTSWKIRDGFTKGAITAIAQTPDGYLWLGTDYGLLRFDGVKGVSWRPPGNQRLPSDGILSLLVARDGTLWIGTQNGLASWKDGILTQYAELAEHTVLALVEDRESSIWAGGWAVPAGKLCVIRTRGAQCYGADDGVGSGVFSLFEDGKGILWAGLRGGLWRWKPDPRRFYAHRAGDLGSARDFIEDDDGALLFSVANGMRRLLDGRIEPYTVQGSAGTLDATTMRRDRDGGLWIGTAGHGLAHRHNRTIDAFTQSDGLSGNSVSSLFEDREGNIWVGTTGGLDRFRNLAAASFSVKQGLSSPQMASVLPGRDGSVWFATGQGLNRWRNGHVEDTPSAVTGRRDALRGQGPPQVHSLFQDRRGRIWVSTLRGIGYLENDQFTLTSSVPRGYTNAIVEDRAGALWIANQDLGLFHLVDGRVVRQFPWTGLGHQDFATALLADESRGGLWVGFLQSGIAYVSDGQVRTSYGVADGLGKGLVSAFQSDRDGTLWITTAGGLSRLKNGSVATLSSKNGLPCDEVHGLVEDDARALWLQMACGLVRIARPELAAWIAEVDRDRHAARMVQATVFDGSDGVLTQRGSGTFSPRFAKAADGRLWFVTPDGVSVLDPRRLFVNTLAPPVHVEQITADHKAFDVASPDGYVRLPPLIRDLQIDYTALSLVAPEKMRFRYKLEGRDQEWQDAGNRRQAFYTDLPPANYRFRVMASNDSGVWNEAGAFVDFSVGAAYYQATWFRVSVAGAFLLLVAAVYQLRVRHVARQVTIRMEERVNERTRIARDLHDTLLQSFQGVLLKFHAVTYKITDADTRQTLETVVEQARRAITEGRDAVHGLRASSSVINDLAEAIGAIANELAANHASQPCPECRVHVEGTPRDLVPLCQDEVYRVAVEALRNAFRHAQARRIEVEIRYDLRQLRVRVRDDGRGIDPKVLEGGARSGHYGLPGMRERARLVGGNLTVWSEIDSGTEAELTIPAAAAYARPGAARSSTEGSYL